MCQLVCWNGEAGHVSCELGIRQLARMQNDLPVPSWKVVLLTLVRGRYSSRLVAPSSRLLAPSSHLTCSSSPRSAAESLREGCLTVTHR
jgi:hypothetical protein